ncbi:MAG: hypothetical protein FRX49_03781 [Trebouxia sp. A1-2]|nr:MAG: hypothetical protein FRX49_03781 [Trebouxia sp. A1-2]
MFDPPAVSSQPALSSGPALTAQHAVDIGHAESAGHAVGIGHAESTGHAVNCQPAMNELQERRRLADDAKTLSTDSEEEDRFFTVSADLLMHANRDTMGAQQDGTQSSKPQRPSWHWVYDLIKEDKAKLRVASEQCLTNM